MCGIFFVSADSADKLSLFLSVVCLVRAISVMALWIES